MTNSCDLKEQIVYPVRALFSGGSGVGGGCGGGGGVVLVHCLSKWRR